MREEFEKLPEINEMLLNNGELKWCYETNRYINHRVFQDAETGYINGAYYAFNEQQKKLDAVKKMIVSLRSEFDLWSDDTESFDAIEDQIENLDELLK